jgi:hypothetical protein
VNGYGAACAPEPERLKRTVDIRPFYLIESLRGFLRCLKPKILGDSANFLMRHDLVKKKFAGLEFP